MRYQTTIKPMSKLSNQAEAVLLSRFGEIREVEGGYLLPSRKGLEVWTISEVEAFAKNVHLQKYLRS